MMNFLEIVLTVLIILVILRYLASFLIKLYFRRMARKMGLFDLNKKEERVGETYIKDTATKEKIVTKDVGDYIDYEEIENK